MCSPLLTCPLCSQPGFQTLDSLRYGLISAATRQVVCPVCHDVLFGLDKFTIHLFSHSVQHQHEENGCILPMNVSAANLSLHQQNSVASQSNNFLLCGKTDFSAKIVNVKEFPSTKSQIDVSADRSLPTTSGMSVCSKEMKIEDKTRIENMEGKQNCKTILCTSEATAKLISENTELNSTWKESVSDQLACKYRTAAHSKDVEFPNIRIQSRNESNQVQSAKKMVGHNSECMETSQMTVVESTSASRDNKQVCPSYHFNAGSVQKPTSTHQNISVPCSALPSTPPPPSPEKAPTERSLKELIRCDICGFAFDDSSILAIHHQLVHSMDSGNNTTNRRVQTSNCFKQGRTTDEKRQFSCHLCTKAFKMRGSLMVHLRVAHSSGLGTGKSFIGRTDPDSHLEDRKFNCHLCSKSFKKEQHLSQHLKTHEGKQWECDVCSKLFTTKYFLKKHKRLHTGETPYSCDTCGKTFTFQQSYHKHLLYHSDDKPHVCTECDRAFKELSTLHNHQRIHTGEKPFACETCGKCFRQRVSYLVHRRIHTGVMPYQCTACGKNFRYKVSQRTHKCPSQPPGTVVRQSGDLVQKLLQGVQQKVAVSSNTQVLPAPASINNNDRGSTVEEPPAAISPRSPDESHHLSTAYQQQQFSSNQFTIIVGSGVQSVFPSGQILLTSSSLYDASSTNTHAVCSRSNENLGTQRGADNCETLENMTEIGRGNRKINMQMTQKLPLVSPTIETTEIKKNKQQNREGEVLTQDGNNNLDVGNTEQNVYEEGHEDSNPKASSSNMTEEKSSYTRNRNKGNSLITENKLTHNSVFLQENEFQGPTGNDLETSACNSSEFWKASNKSDKSVDSTDLVVETTDFFTMVMSPSVKSLPSPSERLKHLTLSSPVDTLLSYEDEGMYQFLLNPDNPTHLESKSGDGASCSSESSVSSSKAIRSKELTHNYISPNNGTDSEPLQTINEESLKQLLYGSTRS